MSNLKDGSDGSESGATRKVPLAVQVRRAGTLEAVAMHALQLRAFEEEARRCGTREFPPMQELPADIEAHIRTQVALVAHLGDTLVGCVRGLREGPTARVRALVVDPGAQGQGVGSALLRALEAELSAAERIELTTNTIMEGNVPFYERHGYQVEHTTEPAPGIVLAHLAKARGPGSADA